MNEKGKFVLKQLVELRNKETGAYYYVHSYAEGPVNSDAYYQENAVLGDLPAGNYMVWVRYEAVVYQTEVEIKAGMVTFFSFWGRQGFDPSPLPTPAPDFEPPDATPTATP
jgi:hypothetical protein